MDLVDDRFISCDFVRSEVFVPLDPLLPLFDGLFPIKLSGNGESGNSVNVCIELLSFFAVLIFLCKDLFNLMLV